MYDTNNNHPLIDRYNNYNLNKKILTIHSEDRDKTKYPYSSCFTIECPQVYQNVETIRMVDISLPSMQETFLNDYQNTKFLFTINNTSTIYILTIQDGFYTPQQLACELQNQLNNATGDTGFNVYYDSVGNSLYFGNTIPFTFLFSKQPTYELPACEQPNMFYKTIQWGLPWNLGFNKIDYTAQIASSDINFNYTIPPTAFIPAGGYFIKAPLNLKINIDTVIYLEINKLNYMDELTPYPIRTNAEFNNKYGGVINSAFIKIPINSNPISYCSNSIQVNLENSGFYIPIIDKISQLQFTFRYHDGRRVNFKDSPFNFSLEINQIRNDIPRPYKARIATFNDF